MNPFTWIKAQLWKLTTALGVVASLYLGIALLVEKAENRHLEKLNTNRAKRIGILEGDLAKQNRAIKAHAAEGDRLRAEAAAALAQAQAQTAVAQDLANGLLAYSPKGSTTCERLLDLDRKLVETLK